jgi:hypothetical protein
MLMLMLMLMLVPPAPPDRRAVYGRLINATNAIFAIRIAPRGCRGIA